MAKAAKASRNRVNTQLQTRNSRALRGTPRDVLAPMLQGDPSLPRLGELRAKLETVFDPKNQVLPIRDAMLAAIKHGALRLVHFGPVPGMAEAMAKLGDNDAWGRNNLSIIRWAGVIAARDSAALRNGLLPVLLGDDCKEGVEPLMKEFRRVKDHLEGLINVLDVAWLRYAVLAAEVEKPDRKRKGLERG